MPFTPGTSGNPRGRPRRADKFARPIAQAEKKIADQLPHLVDKLVELADGVLVEHDTPEGPLVYQRPPDFKALEYLLNRIMGKPTERLQAELGGADGSAIRVEAYAVDYREAIKPLAPSADA